MADTNERKHDRIVIAETLEAIVALQFDTNAKYLRTLADAATELRKADAELAATTPADAALADSIDSLGFVISGDNPPVKEWVSECGGGCMPATKEEKMMWDVLQSALRARAVPDAVALNDARWRALIGCKRIRLIGCSGVHPDGTLMADRDGHVHFGAEFWTHHDSESSQVSINVITAFADAMLAASKEDGK